MGGFLVCNWAAALLTLGMAELQTKRTLLKLKNKTNIGVPKTANLNPNPDQFYNGNPSLLRLEPKQKAPKVNSKENIKKWGCQQKWAARPSWISIPNNLDERSLLSLLYWGIIYLSRSDAATSPVFNYLVYQRVMNWWIVLSCPLPFFLSLESIFKRNINFFLKHAGK